MSTEPRGTRVLVLDDDPAVAQMLARVLHGLGADVLLAETLLDAFSVFDAAPPAIAFIDVHLQNGNGLDLVPEIKRQHPECLAVVVTGDERPEVRDAADRVGVDAFLVKPVRLDALRSLLQRAA